MMIGLYILSSIGVAAIFIFTVGATLCIQESWRKKKLRIIKDLIQQELRAVGIDYGLNQSLFKLKSRIEFLEAGHHRGEK